MEPKKVHTGMGRRKHKGPESRYNLAKVTSGAKGRVRIRTRVLGVGARVAKSGGGMVLGGWVGEALPHWGFCVVGSLHSP